MNIIRWLRGVFNPNTQMQESKDKFDLAFRRFMQEMRQLDPLYEQPKEKAKHHEQH